MNETQNVNAFFFFFLKSSPICAILSEHFVSLLIQRGKDPFCTRDIAALCQTGPEMDSCTSDNLLPLESISVKDSYMILYSYF